MSLEAAAEVPSTDTLTIGDGRLERLSRAMRRLGAVERALLMCYLDGLTYSQIGDVLGISETNVGARLTRTRAKLQELVEEKG